MDHTPSINVLLPVYNRPEFLMEAVNSILRQTHQDWQLIIYDDGSSCDYSIPKDTRIRFVRGETNLGVAGARNRLLDLISAPLACWQDSDDVSHPARLARLVEYMTEHPKVSLAPSYMYFFAGGKPHTHTRTIHRVDPSKWHDPHGMARNFTFATSVFRSSLRAKYRFDPQYRGGGEDVRWVRQMVSDGLTFGRIPEPLYYCRRHPGRLTTIRQGKQG